MTEIIVANLDSAEHGQAVVSLLNEYATDIMGGGKTLSEFTQAHLVEELRKRENCCVVLAWVEGTPAGLAICFEGFSTFSCKAIMNIHDFLVAPKFRGQGLSQALLTKIEAIASDRNCCKLTLEVLEGNQIAQHVYKKFGFGAYELDPEMGRALFYEKKINEFPNGT